MTRRLYVLVLVGTLHGCTTFNSSDKAMKANMADPRESAMLQQANVYDGYEMLSGNLWNRFASPPPVGKFKVCGRLERFMKAPGEPTAMDPLYFPALRSDIATLTANGTLPSDRYYASAESGVFVSVPAGDGAMFGRNIDAERVCFWSEGTVQSLRSPRGTGNVFHVTISRWTGMLDASAQVVSAAPSSTPPAAPSVEPPAAAAARVEHDDDVADMLCSLEVNGFFISVPVKDGRVLKLGSYQRVVSTSPGFGERGEVEAGVQIVDGQWVNLKIIGDDVVPGTTVRVRITGNKLEVDGQKSTGACEP